MKYFITIILYLILAGCSTNKSISTDKTTDFTQKLVGKWIWVSTKICQRTNPPVQTPLSLGFTKKLIFSANEVNSYKNHSLDGTSTYKIIKLEEEIGYAKKLIKSELINGTIFIENDTLTISTCYRDGAHIKYVKIKD